MTKQCSTNGKYDFDLLVIGCGPAGQRAAIQASKLRKRVAIIDRRDVVGGNCLNVGTIPSKSFKEAVVFLSGYRQRNFYGPGFRVKAEIEMSDLTFRCNRIIERETEVIRDQLVRNEVELIQGIAKFVDKNTLSVTSHSGVVNISAEYILIATGARPRRPEGFEFDGENIFDSDDILTMKRLPRTMTVIGGGVIGTEYGSMFAALGVHVTVVDSRKRLLGFVDAEVIECLQYHMRSMGVTLRLGEEVESCHVRKDNQVVTQLKSGKVVVSDCILVSAGRISETDKLGLDAIGLDTDERGRIAVDNQYRSSIPNIFAAGDVIGFPALASTSAAQGRLVSVNAFGLSDEVEDYPLPYGIYSIPELSCVGVNEDKLTEQGIPYEAGVARYREIARGQIIGDENGMLKILFHRETEEILGVHVIGENSTELIHVGQAVMSLKGGLSYLRDAVFNYPTLAECYKVAAFDGYNKLRA